jgi:predicted RNA-binding Zn ribbon-like protein
MLWDEFLNSLHHDWRGDGTADDRLDNAKWLDEWVWSYYSDVGVPSAKQLNALKELRSLMHRIVVEFVGQNSPSLEDLEALNAVMAKGTVIRQLSNNGVTYQLEQRTTNNDWVAIQSDIAASMGKMMAEGDPSRLRICDNPSCLWIYYDDTRNRSKRYCDDKMCGNLMKVRRFRARQKTAESIPPGNA